MYEARFLFRPGDYDEDFHRLNEQVEAAAANNPGFRGSTKWHHPDDALVMVIYRWDSRESLDEFATHPDHLAAKRRYDEWYDGYQVVVSEIRDEYGDDDLALEREFF